MSKMTKKKLNQMKKEVKSNQEQEVILRTNPVSKAVKAAAGLKANDMIVPANSLSIHLWKDVDELRDAIANMVMTITQDMLQVRELVNSHGCDDLKEFNTVFETAQRDLLIFSNDFKRVRMMHHGKSGPIIDADEQALSLQIIENYEQFRTKFLGVTQHTLIYLTEYSLQARDRAREAEKNQVKPA